MRLNICLWGNNSFNSELQAETAELITEIFTEVIIAPTISEEAKNVISKKKI